jgi:hypothetical protein
MHDATSGTPVLIGHVCATGYQTIASGSEPREVDLRLLASGEIDDDAG